MDKLRRRSKRILIGVVGVVVVLVGLVLIPYPGPGWLIVFGGFAILATEFAFAQKALDWLRAKYDGWVNWLKVQPFIVRIIIIGLTGLLVLATIWLLNTFGVVDRLFHLHQPWLVSPLFR